MLNSTIAYLNEDIIQVSHQAQHHGLSLNPSKTKAIIFSSSPNLSYISTLALPPLLVSNQAIKLIHQVKRLGLILTADLTWKIYILSVSSKGPRLRVPQI